MQTKPPNKKWSDGVVAVADVGGVVVADVAATVADGVAAVVAVVVVAADSAEILLLPVKTPFSGRKSVKHLLNKGIKGIPSVAFTVDFSCPCCC